MLLEPECQWHFGRSPSLSSLLMAWPHMRTMMRRQRANRASRDWIAMRLESSLLMRSSFGYISGVRRRCRRASRLVPMRTANPRFRWWSTPQHWVCRCTRKWSNEAHGSAGAWQLRSLPRLHLRLVTIAIASTVRRQTPRIVSSFGSRPQACWSWRCQREVPVRSSSRRRALFTVWKQRRTAPVLCRPLSGSHTSCGRQSWSCRPARRRPEHCC
mmetsp:Transcript_11579/g.26199  ORF Transcript_11579/g.26199 Transcript_11579/m.26199 type:complete len:214 (+) Transcript_11579:25-666(+)